LDRGPHRLVAIRNRLSLSLVPLFLDPARHLCVHGGQCHHRLRSATLEMGRIAFRHNLDAVSFNPDSIGGGEGSIDIGSKTERITTRTTDLGGRGLDAEEVLLSAKKDLAL
jgi:hypothetical protein